MQVQIYFILLVLYWIQKTNIGVSISGWYPPQEWADRMRNTMMSVAPKGMTQIYPMMCGTCSNENAIKLMFMR